MEFNSFVVLLVQQDVLSKLPEYIDRAKKKLRITKSTAREL